MLARIQKSRKNSILVLVALIGVCASVLSYANPRHALSQSLDKISVSLSVFDSQNEAVDGTFEVRFALYSNDRTKIDPYPSNADADARIWSETKTVEVKNGIIRTELGDTESLPTSIFSDPSRDYYLAIRIADDSEMVPRKKVASTPSALNAISANRAVVASDAEALDGKTIGTGQGDIPLLGSGGKLTLDLLPIGEGTEELVLGDDGRLHEQNTDTGTDSAVFTIGTGTTIGTENFDFSVSDASSKPTLRFDASSRIWQLSNDGSAFSGIITEASGGNMTGDIVFAPEQTFGGANLTELGYLSGSRSNIQQQIDDLPHTASDFTSGTLPTALGGTGIDASAAANGTILIGNGEGFSLGALEVYGAGMSITTGSGVIRLTNTGVASLVGTLNQVNVSEVDSQYTLSLPQDIAMASKPTFSGVLYKAEDGEYSSGIVGNPDQAEDITYIMPQTTGTVGQVLRTNGGGLLSWTTIIGGEGSGIGTVLEVGAGDGLTSDVMIDGESGNPIIESGTLSIALSSDETDTLTVSSPSGLEFEDHKLSLLRGCASDQVLAWDETNKLWQCSTVAGTDGLIGGGTAGYAAYWSGVGTLASEAALSVSRGGTGNTATPDPGQILIGNGVGYTLANLTAGDGISMLTSGQSEPGSITIASVHGDVIDLDGASAEVNGILPVSNGGTGVDSLTSKGVLYGNGSGVVQATAAGSAGQFLLVNASGNPAFSTLVGDASLDSAGSLTIASGVVTGAKIAEDTVKEVNLVAATQMVEGVPLPLENGDVLTYDSMTEGFMWSSAGTGGIGDIVTIGDVINGDAFDDGGTQGTSLWFHNGTKQGQLTTANLETYDRTYTLPDANGTILTTGNLTEIVSVGVIKDGTWEGDTVAPRYGGTGRDGTLAEAGQILIGNGDGSGYTLAQITQGAGLEITNGTGSITIKTEAPTSVSNGTNVTGSISGNVLTLGWTGALSSEYGGTGFSFYNKGDILYGNASGVISALPIGTENYILRSVGGVPTWQEFSVAPIHDFLSDRHADTAPGTVERGALIVGQGVTDSKWTKLTLGEEGSILRSDGLDAVWGTITKSDIGLGAVENTALSTWEGTSYITTLGTVTNGDWHGSVISAQYGGTGLNASTLSGVPIITDGTWSVSSSLSVTQGGTGTSVAFDKGSIVFAGASGAYSQDSSNLFWDAANRKFGIGISTPSSTLHVTGDARIDRGLVLAEAEGFEDETFVPADWTTGGDADWLRTTDAQYELTASAQSGSVSDDQESWIGREYDFPFSGRVTFRWKVDSESGWDYLLFCVDNNDCTSSSGYVERISGSVDWTEVSYDVEASGQHSFRWRYVKGATNSSGADAAWIDDIRIESASTSGNLLADGDVSVGRNLLLADATSGQTGVVYKGADRFIHNFSAPGSLGGNFFSGIDSGNFSMTGFHDTGVGEDSLKVLSSGSYNTAIGSGALKADTTGGNNSALGYGSLSSNVSGSGNVAVGSEALSSNTTGSNNVAIGYDAGKYQSNAAPLTTAANGVYIGYNAKGYNNFDVNSIVIGSGAVGLGANTTVIGTESTVLTKLFGNTQVGEPGVRGDLSVEGSLSILEGAGSSYHTTFVGGDQTGDITYILPTSNSTGFLKNSSGTLFWDGGSYPMGTGTNGYNVYWTGPGTLGSEANMAVTRGGTGIGTAPADGQLLIGNASGGYTLANLTAESGISVTNDSGAIMIATTAPTSVSTSDANLRGTITNNSLVLTWEGALAVGRGGTGNSTLAKNGVLFGNGTEAISATVAGTVAQFLVANASGTPTFVSMSGDATIDETGEISINASAVGSTEIEDASIKAADFLVTAAATPGYILSYNSTSGGFTWIENSGGTGASQFTDGGDFIYLTATTDDMVLGSDSSGNAPFFFDISTGNITLGGSSNDEYTTILSVTDPTASNAITIPDASGEMSLLGQTIETGEIADGTILPSDLNATLPSNGAVLIYDVTDGGKFSWGAAGEGGIGTIVQVGDVEYGSAFTDGGVGSSLWFHSEDYQGQFNVATLTEDRTYTLPDANGTIVLGSGSPDFAGYVPYWNGTNTLSYDVLGSYWDSENHRLGIGTDVPSQTLTVKGDFGISEGGESPSHYTSFRGGNQTADIAYTLPSESSNGLLRNTDGGLSWDGTSYPMGTGEEEAGYSIYWTGVGTLGSEQYLAVSRGGTGAGTFTANGVLFGKGTNAVAATAAGTEAQVLVANASGVPTFVSMSGDMTIDALGQISIGTNAVTLGTDTTGNYVASITNGSGISGSAGGSEGADLTLNLGVLTQNWSQTGAFDISLSNAASELRIMDTTGIYYGTFDVADLSASQTYSFAGNGGTVWTSGNDGSGSGLDADTLDTYSSADFQLKLTNPVTGTGTNGYNAYWTGAGTIGSEQYVAPSRGGLGIDTSFVTGVPVVANGSWSISSSLGVAHGGTGTSTAFTSGSVVFAGADGVYSQSNQNLFWDDSRRRFGIGLAGNTPNAALDIRAYGATSVPTIGSEMLESVDMTFQFEHHWTSSNWSVDPQQASYFSPGTDPLSLSGSNLLTAPVAGKTYKISYSTNTTNSGTLTVSFGSQSVVETSPNGSRSLVVTATGTDGISFIPDSGWTGNITAVSVTEMVPSDPVMIVRNADNSIALEIRGGTSSNKGTFLGYQTGQFTTTGTYDTFVGYQSGANNTTGSLNSSIGYQAFFRNAIGAQNNAMGYQSLYSNTSGNSNNAIGFQSMHENVSGSSNNAMGYGSLYSNTTGGYNSAVGREALYSNVSGSNNVAFGYQAGRFQKDAPAALADPENSIYIGYNAKGYSNDDNNSIVIGYNAVGLGANTAVIGNSNTILTRLYGNLALGSDTANQQLSVAGTFGIRENDSENPETYYTIFQGGDQTSDITYTLPTESSVRGLLRNENGVLRWDESAGNVSGDGTTGYSAYWTGTHTIGSEQHAAISRGGTGIGTAPAQGQFLIGNASGGYSLAQITTSGTGISVANGDGTVTLSNTGVTALSGTANQVNISSTTGAVTLSLPQSIATTSAPTFAGAKLTGITNGSVLFAGTGGIVSQDNANFFWDGSNARLGLGTKTPVARLDVKGGNTLAILGSEMILDIHDREFTTPATGNWSGNGWSTDYGYAEHDSAGADSFSLANSALASVPVSGRTYRISFEVSTTPLSPGTVNIAFGGVSYGALASPSGTVTVLIAAGGTGSLTFTPDSAWKGHIDNVSVREVTASDPIMVARNNDPSSSAALEIRGGSNTYGTFLGAESGRFTTGTNDLFAGYQSGSYNISGRDNSGVGYQSLRYNAEGSYNTAVGSRSLYANATGSNNAVVGYQSLSSNINGSNSAAVGYQSLYRNVVGSDNTAFGYQSLYGNVSGSYDIAIGSQAVYSNTTGAGNIGLGTRALYGNTTGSNNIAIGYDSGRYQANGTTPLTTAVNSVYIGSNARGYSNEDSNSVVIGSGAVGLGANTTVIGSSSTTLSKLYGSLLLDPSGYLNFGLSGGNAGYGLYDNGGTIQFKNSGGSWQNIGETMGIGGPVNSAAAGSVLFVDSSNNLAQDNANFFWDSTNHRLGLGTTAPAEPLHVLKTTDADTRIQVSNLNTGPSATAGLKLTGSGGSSFLYMTGSSNAVPNATILRNDVTTNGVIAFDMNYYGVSGEAMRISNAGNVGIGTANPTANFQVNQKTTGIGTVSNTAGGTTVTGTNTKFTQTFKVGDTITIGGQSVAISAINSDTSMTTTAILNANTGVSYTLTGGTRFAVLGNGNVGIGTASPSAMLDLYGAGNALRLSYGSSVYNSFSTTSSGDLLLTGSDVYDSSMRIGNDSDSNAAVLFDTLSSDYYAGVDHADRGKFKIGKTDADAFLTIDPSGRIGIGDTSPEHALDVDGNIGLSTSGYVNFGAIDGEAGYGFRDNAGTVQYRNSGGAWLNFMSGSGTTGQVAYWTGSGTLAGETYLSVSRGGTGTGTAPGSGQFLIGNGTSYNPGTFSTSGAGISSTASSTGILLSLEQGIATTSSPTFAGITIASDGSTIMDINAVSSTFNNPAAFTAVGDVSMAYDLIMTNQTSSFIRSNGPLSISSGEVFESNDLVLQTYNAGEVVVDGGSGAAYPFHVYRSSDGNVAGFSDSNGTCAINPTNTGLICSSDETLKKDIVSLSADESLVLMNKLRPVSFHWNAESVDDPLRIGLIAQEVRAVLPDLVSIGPDNKLAVNYLGLVPYMLSASQAQQSKIEVITDRLAGLDLKTDGNVVTLSELQVSVDSNLLLVGDAISGLSAKQDEFDGRLTTIDDRVLSVEASLTELFDTSSADRERVWQLEAEMTALRDEHLTLMDFFATFNLDRVVIADAGGNVDLLDGKLVAKVVATGGLEIEVRDPEAPTIGTAVLYPVAKDDDSDGNDDYTGIPMDDPAVSGRDGKTVIIDTTAVSEKSLIYVTPVGSTGNRVLFVGSVRDGEGFSVGMDEPATESVRLNWWIVGKNEFPSVEEDASKTVSTGTKDADGTEEAVSDESLASDEPAV